MHESAELELSVDAGLSADADELDRLAASLRSELLELDVDAVEPVVGGAPPDDARAVDALVVGALLVRLARSTGVLSAVVQTVRTWVGERSDRRVRLELDGDVLELTGASDEERERLIDAWIGRHARG